MRCACAVALLVLLSSTARAAEPELLKTDSRAPYVHLLTLYDHDGKAIDPSDEPALPYSPAKTCGRCHAYGEIAGGWHFSEAQSARTLLKSSGTSTPQQSPSGSEGAGVSGPGPSRSTALVDGPPGEPWLTIDPDSGLATPISGRGWEYPEYTPWAFKRPPGPYVLTPAEAGLSHWQFIKQFGHHTPGGGFGEPTDAEIAASKEKLRWGISGRLEIDCMMCHSADWAHDPTEMARQIEAENFKWEPTVALGLATIRGEARKAPDDWDPMMPPNPDQPGAAGPTLTYDKRRFDRDDRVFFNITRRVPNERCYFCHTTRRMDMPDWHTDQDVHIAAGLMCVDCHRHGLDHRIVRGYETEAIDTGDIFRATLSCRGCHLGQQAGEEEEEEGESRRPKLPETEDGAFDPALLGGRFRAPHPQHAGFPPLHFEKLSCTACHSGPWPDAVTFDVQTSLAHRLGLATRDRTAATPPRIVEPAFIRDEHGVLTPHRLVAVKRVQQSPSGSAGPSSTDSDPLLKSSGTRSGETAAGGAYYAWPMAHDVRPAAQALGVRGCTDCHAADAPIFVGKVEATGLSIPMAQLNGYDAGLARIWATSFIARPAFKWFGFACAALIALVLLRATWDGFTALVFGTLPASAAATTTTAPPAFPSATARWLGGACLAIAALATLGGIATSFAPNFVGIEMEGWILISHMAAGGAFLAGLTGAALLLGGSHRRPYLTRGRWSAWTFWLMLAAGLGVALTMLAAMLPRFGYAVQHELKELHEKAAIALIAFLVLHLVLRMVRRK